jgi:hypothetical protein
VISERLERRPGMAPAVFSSPIFIGSASGSWFRVSLPPPHENVSGIPFIGVLGQDHQSKIKTDDIGGSRCK